MHNKINLLHGNLDAQPFTNAKDLWRRRCENLLNRSVEH